MTLKKLDLCVNLDRPIEEYYVYSDAGMFVEASIAQMLYDALEAIADDCRHGICHSDHLSELMDEDQRIARDALQKASK